MTDDATVRTVSDPGEAALRVRGSRFLARIRPVDDVAAAETAIERARTDHPEATHVVSAYRIRDGHLREARDDAGEPRGTAGPPVLGVLRGEELEGVLALVIRYFGGTELGTGGLVRAYSRAVKRALDATTIVERPPSVTAIVTATYDDSGTIRGILEGSASSFDATYEETVTFRVDVPVAEAPAIRERVMNATRGRATWRAD